MRRTPARRRWSIGARSPSHRFSLPLRDDFVPALSRVRKAVEPITGARLVHRPPAGRISLQACGARPRSTLEVSPVAARRRTALALVLRAEPGRAVRVVRRLRHLDERQLADLHPGVDRDRQVGDVRQLERDVPVPAGVDEPCRRVDQQAEPSERALPLESCHEVVGQLHALERRAEHELAGMEDERLAVPDLDELASAPPAPALRR